MQTTGALFVIVRDKLLNIFCRDCFRFTAFWFHWQKYHSDILEKRCHSNTDWYFTDLYQIQLLPRWKVYYYYFFYDFSTLLFVFDITVIKSNGLNDCPPVTCFKYRFGIIYIIFKSIKTESVILLISRPPCSKLCFVLLLMFGCAEGGLEYVHMLVSVLITLAKFFTPKAKLYVYLTNKHPSSHNITAIF